MVLAYGIQARYEDCFRGHQIFGRQLRVVVEIIDSEGGYATDEALVMPLEPIGWPTPAPAGSRTPAPTTPTPALPVHAVVTTPSGAARTQEEVKCPHSSCPHRGKIQRPTRKSFQRPAPRKNFAARTEEEFPAARD